MNKILNAFIHMSDLDDIGTGDSSIHRLHPLLKIICCFILIICIITSYHLLELLMYFVLCMFIVHLSHLSYKKVLKRGLLGLPFSFCLGISFLLFHHHQISFYGFMINEGVLLFIFVLLKTNLCLMMTYLLISTTSFDVITSELIHIKIPAPLVLSITMTYRYIFTFLIEAKNMSIAYSLRNPNSQGIDIKNMGSFIGHLLIKSMNESSRIYDAMKCRGYDITKSYRKCEDFEVENIFLLMMIISFLIIVKVIL